MRHSLLHEPVVVVSRRPTLKRGSGETVYKKFELWNVYCNTPVVIVLVSLQITTINQPYNNVSTIGPPRGPHVINPRH